MMSNQTRESSAKRGYGHKWQVARQHYLNKHPLCVEHQRKGQVVIATVVDHIEPHRGDMTVFWDSGNWQSLCKLCHDGYKQRLEKSGTIAGCNVDGRPLDPKHHWNR